LLIDLTKKCKLFWLNYCTILPLISSVVVSYRCLVLHIFFCYLNTFSGRNNIRWLDIIIGQIKATPTRKYMNKDYIIHKLYYETYIFLVLDLSLVCSAQAHIVGLYKRYKAKSHSREIVALNYGETGIGKEEKSDWDFSDMAKYFSSVKENGIICAIIIESFAWALHTLLYIKTL